MAADLRRIYSAPTADLAEAELDAFEEKWAGKYASIAPAWRRAWQEVIPFFGFDPAIRKIIYTTNAIESLNRVIRKSIKTRGSFPTDEAATKLIYLAIRKFEKDGRNVREWFAPAFCVHIFLAAIGIHFYGNDGRIDATLEFLKVFEIFCR